MKKHLDKFIIFLIVLLVLFATYLQLATQDSTNKLRSDEVNKSQQYVEKIAKLIRKKTGDNIEKSLTQNENLVKNLNDILEAFLTKQYRYIYMFYKDEAGHLRVLLDGSTEDKSEYKEYFAPQNNYFDETYKNGKLRMVDQRKGVDGAEDVWMSFLYPIVVNGKTEALLNLELSKEYSEYLNNFNSPLMNVLKWMQRFLLASILLLIFLAYRYYQLNRTLNIDRKTTAFTKQYIAEFLNHHKINEYNAFLVDIDEFRNINEQYGVEFGDKLLKIFVKRMVSNLNKKARIVSSGGAEFFILVPKSIHKIDLLANQFYKSIKEIPYKLDNEVVTLGITMSAMHIPNEAKLLSNIQRISDEQLLIAKNRGKDNLIVLDNTSIEKIKYSNFDYVKEALNSKRICCLYQPIVDTSNKEIVKYEALVRMRDKEDHSKIISPYYFLKTIKGTSQYIKMSRIVLEHVFDTLEKHEYVHISMNLDLDDLYNIKLIELISEYLEKHQKMSTRLTFEIVEENNIYDFDKVNSVFAILREYGSKIAIDDFGSGYANYAYLTKLNVDIIKIDGSLIKDLLISPERTRVVLKSIKELAAELNLEVVAEFISDENLYKEVKEIGITYAQGYHLGEPKPIEEYLG